MKTCAIVILNYNGEKVLPIFLPSVVEHSQSDIWVVDNASTDNSVQVLKNQFPQVQLITLQSNFGFAGGYNWGLEELRGKYSYFLLLNSDVEVTPFWDQGLVAWLENHSEFASVQPKILSWQEKNKFDYAGAGGGYIDALGYPYCRGRVWNEIEEDQGQYDDSLQVDWSSGACMLIKAEDFFSQDGFDAHFFAHMEEIDLCWRLRLAGRKIGYLGEVKVYHQGGATLSRANPKKLYLNVRNSLGMLYKNLGKGTFSIVLLLKALLEMCSALGYWIIGKGSMSKAILQGYVDFFKSRSLYHRTKRKRPDLEISRSGPVKFIFWHFFVLQKRTFKDL
jgi:GT2 family glycosyltransferase